MTNFLTDPPEPLPEHTLEALAYLRDHLVDGISPEEAADTPKVARKAKVLYQCMVRRVLDAADGTALGWNGGNLLTSITMARSLVETVAALNDLSDKLSDALGRESLDEVDAILMARLFAWRTNPIVITEIPSSTNVLTLIDRLDRWLKRVVAPEASVRGFYEGVSEFAHPNYLGITLIYSHTDNATGAVSFGATKETRTDVYADIRSALGLVGFAEIAVRWLEDHLPEIARLNVAAIDESRSSSP
jgi:hypothetical protein